MRGCLYGDPACPCQDGDLCNHRPYGDSFAEPPPASFWRVVPCGHPANPVAWIGRTGVICHCGSLLDPDASTSFVMEHDGDGAAEWPIVSCQNCGCHVAVPLEAEQ